MARNRYPQIRISLDGKRLCRGCGGPIPKGRRTWCSQKCFERYLPAAVCRRVFIRDGKKCVLCGDDRGGIEFDHIIPFSEGGKTVDENMRTLCCRCHLIRTREWRRQKAEQRRAEKAGQQQPLNSGL